jgi:predicted GTPase
MKDLDEAECTIEEREEYEPHIAAGNIVYAGVDYAKILARAEEEAQVILWDGGNNDFSFYKPDLQIVLVDPLRPGHETTHHPGEAVLRMADIVVIAKTNSAAEVDIQHVAETARSLAPGATIIRAASEVRLDDPAAVRGRKVIVVDDGPTITHGGMGYGAGYVAAVQGGAGEIVDPRLCAVGDIADVYRKFPHIRKVLPAMGYSDKELADLRATLNASGADVVVAGTPMDLSHLIQLNKPLVRARYDFKDVGAPRLGELVLDFLKSRDLIARAVA